MYFENKELNERWSVVNSKLLANETNTNSKWYDDVKSSEYENTTIHLGIDKQLSRPVIIKTINYRNKLDNELVLNSREIFNEQINLLNEISSPQLPVPLDLFNVINDKDRGMNSVLAKEEPVFVLEYQPGETLKKELKRAALQNNENIRLDSIARKAKNILYFIKASAQKDYIHLGLTPEHIIMLKNENIRVVGLSKIHKTQNNKVKIEDIKCRYTYGHTAPELYDIDIQKEMDAKSIASFSLGVLLCLLLCEEEQVNENMTVNIDNNIIFEYPNEYCRNKIKQNVKNPKIYSLIDKLLCDLCNRDPLKRITDFDKIEEILAQIGGEVVVKNNEKKLIQINRKGEIISKPRKNRWVVQDQDNFAEYDIYHYGEDKEVLDSLKVGSLVEFNIVQNPKGKKNAVKIRICQNHITEEELKPYGKYGIGKIKNILIDKLTKLK